MARIWIISSQHWPRAFLRAELLERGYEVEAFEEFAQAHSALGHPKQTKPDLILLELIDQALTPTNFSNLQHAAIPVVALGGAADLTEPIRKAFPWAAILQRPYTIGDVCRVVADLSS